eukprot:gene14638-16157_t
MALPQKSISKEVVINIGIAEWHPKTDSLRKKHGKRLVLREAVYIPGSQSELFTIGRYQEEVGKDFRRIALYISAKADFDLHFNSNPESPSNLQVTKDHELALSLQASLNKDIVDDDIELADGMETSKKGVMELHDTSQVVQVLHEKVLQTEQIFLTTRREVPINRIIQLWQRERKQKPANSRVVVKFRGELGIDTGALSREFFADTMKDIGKSLFPKGTPVHFTFFIKNGAFRTAGEIIAASIAQNGPPPCFLEEVVYNAMINPDVDLSSLDPSLHLTSSEREEIAEIRSNFTDCHDLILDHGYTGPLKEEKIEDIVGSIVVSMVSRRQLALKELMEGFQAYDLKKHLMNNSKLCQALFIKGKADEVDANYLVNLLYPDFPEKGNQHRAAEDQVLDNFQDFISCLEDQKMSSIASAVAWNYDDEDDEYKESNGEERYQCADLTQAGVMQWLAGKGHRDLTASNIKITVKFNHSCREANPKHTVCYPVVGACVMEITFPVVNMVKYEEFKDIFMTVYCKGQAFGRSKELLIF